VNIDNLRPWEYENMIASVYDTVTLVRRAYHEEQRWQAEMEAAKRAATP
jgi:hypothetical protein